MAAVAVHTNNTLFSHSLENNSFSNDILTFCFVLRRFVRKFCQIKSRAVKKRMRTTKQLQREKRRLLDEKLALQHPSSNLLDELSKKYTTDPSPDNSFQYAFSLCKSKDPSELKYSISILDSLMKNGYEHEVDCMYGSAVAHYLLGEYDTCRLICEAILRNRPENDAAAELHSAAISRKDEADEMKARNIAVGGTLAIAAVGLALLFGGKKRK